VPAAGLGRSKVNRIAFILLRLSTISRTIEIRVEYTSNTCFLVLYFGWLWESARVLEGEPEGYVHLPVE